MKPTPEEATLDEIRRLLSDGVSISAIDPAHFYIGHNAFCGLRFERPAPKPDRWAVEKAAHAAGKVIQMRLFGDSEWTDLNNPAFDGKDAEYRVKPWSLPKPPEGLRWHRDDWQEDMLPKGWRPRLKGEKLDVTNFSVEVISNTRTYWVSVNNQSYDFERYASFVRTNAPLPSPPRMVPLSRSDVPLNSWFRLPCGEDVSTGRLTDEGFWLGEKEWCSWERIRLNGWLITRDNGASWEKCEKVAP